jgi:D-sedoheptulose 7-phosphate isomerase
MSDAMHFCEELTGKFRKPRNPLAAIAINDPGHISCVSNDYSYDDVFSRYVEALGKNGDVLLAISTSGHSKNVLKAAQYAKANGIKVIALTGKDGGELINHCDISLIVPSMITDKIQEIHIQVIHNLIEGVEREIFPENYA